MSFYYINIETIRKKIRGTEKWTKEKNWRRETRIRTLDLEASSLKVLSIRLPR